VTRTNVIRNSETLGDRALNILAVDDSEVILEFVTSVLEDAGHTVYQASSAAAAIDALDANSVDLVMTDINMQGTDGYALARNLRDSDRFGSIPIVFVTGDASEEFKSKCHSAGGNGWLKKPFKPEQMLGVIKTYA